jgi:predicted GNAT family N-acyltransferase
MKQTGQYTFRELHSYEDLAASFRLRYDVYRSSSIAVICAENEISMDFDVYDLRSRHFGLYKKEGDGETLIGSVRLITNQPTAGLDAFKYLLNPASNKKEKLFYFLDFFDNAQILLPFSIEQEADFIYEPSRFALKKAYRSLGLAQFVIESIITVCCETDLKWAIITCPKSKNIIYEQYGFEFVSEKEVNNYTNALLQIGNKRAHYLNPDLAKRIALYRCQGCFNYTVNALDFSYLKILPYYVKQSLKNFVNY